MSNPCEGCALTKGATANLEPENHLKALICVYGGRPFWCHHEQDWQDPSMHERMTASEFRARGFQICAGWVREVRALIQKGHFDSRRKIKRAVADAAMEELEIFLNTPEGSEDKREAQAALERLTRQLFASAGFTEQEVIGDLTADEDVYPSEVSQ